MSKVAVKTLYILNVLSANVFSQVSLAVLPLFPPILHLGSEAGLHPCRVRAPVVSGAHAPGFGEHFKPEQVARLSLNPAVRIRLLIDEVQDV